MKQQGFSLVLIVLGISALLAVGFGGYWAMNNPDGYKKVFDENASSSPVAHTSNGEHTNSGKSKVRACDLLTISQVSSIVGVAMEYIPDVTEEMRNYEDGDLWTSTCSYQQKGGTVESNAGVVFMITEALSPEAKTELKALFNSNKKEEGGVAISGFGDAAYKVVPNDSDDFNPTNYYVMVGDMTIWVNSSVGKGVMVGERVEDVTVESKDSQAEAILRHVLSQL